MDQANKKCLVKEFIIFFTTIPCNNSILIHGLKASASSRPVSLQYEKILKKISHLNKNSQNLCFGQTLIPK